jgi:hypothetical protein
MSILIEVVLELASELLGHLVERIFKVRREAVE